MDFFGAQEQAHRRIAWLVALYVLAVAGIIAAVYLVVAIVLAYGAEDAGLTYWHPEWFLAVAGGILALVLGGTLFKTLQLSRGGAAVAESLGGRRMDPGSTVPAERRLLNVVEEMALAAGTPVPTVYLLAEETGINAFAAGFTPRDAVIGVTRGALEQLSRDELQGVVAHEFSHIISGDMRLNIRLMGVLFGILLLTVIGRILLRSIYFSGGGGRSRGGNRNRGGNPLPFIGLALMVIGYIGVLVANLIKSAISRQREYRSDAAAVQYTRNPDGLAGALKKIAAWSPGARVRHVHAPEASHLFFGPVGALGFTGLFSTHPPLRERIRRLDPGANPEVARASGGRIGRSAVMGLAGDPGRTISDPGTIHLAGAADLLRRLPESLREAAHTPDGARALVYALLESRDPGVLSRQRAIIQSDPGAATRLNAIETSLRESPAASRIPLAGLAVPALRQMNREEFEHFRLTVEALSEADDRMDLFEFALRHLILRQVEPAFGSVNSAPVRLHVLAKAIPPAAEILAGLAIWGTHTPDAADACFRAGMDRLDCPDAQLPKEPVSLERIEGSLKTLSEASPAIKRRLLDACTACILADGRAAIPQIELLHAVSYALDIPMPPMPPAGN